MLCIFAGVLAGVCALPSRSLSPAECSPVPGQPGRQGHRLAECSPAPGQPGHVSPRICILPALAYCNRCSLLCCPGGHTDGRGTLELSGRVVMFGMHRLGTMQRAQKIPQGNCKLQSGGRKVQGERKVEAHSAASFKPWRTCGAQPMDDFMLAMPSNSRTCNGAAIKKVYRGLAPASPARQEPSDADRHGRGGSWGDLRAFRGTRSRFNTTNPCQKGRNVNP